MSQTMNTTRVAEGTGFPRPPFPHANRAPPEYSKIDVATTLRPNRNGRFVIEAILPKRAAVSRPPGSVKNHAGSNTKANVDVTDAT